MEQKKILVIDDESPIADMLADFCENLGFETKVLTSGESAVEVAKTFKPNLITTDLMMPGVSGIEVIEKLKADPQTEGIPILVISSNQWAKDMDVPLRMTQAVITKPVTMKILGEKIDAVLAK